MKKIILFFILVILTSCTNDIIEKEIEEMYWAWNETDINIIIPAYTYPKNSEFWERLNIKVKEMPGRICIIVNPGNGPGISIDRVYVNTINDIRNSGAKVIGYIHTSWGGRDIDDIKMDIDCWFDWYNIDGIFIDEQSNIEGFELYYLDLYNYIKTKKDDIRVVNNPGVVSPESYLVYNGDRVSDIICMYENSETVFEWNPPNWINKYDKSNFLALPYNVTIDNYKVVANNIINGNIGWLYLTDDTFPNPWDTLPEWFEDFCDFIK